MAEPIEEPNLVKQEDLPEGVRLRNHVYDGIQEYDQQLPNWWLATFYGAVIFFVAYWFAYYQLGAYDTDAERIEGEMAKLMAKKSEQLEQQLSTLSDEVLWKMSRDPTVVASGKATYDTTCFACHAADLSAMIGGVKLPGQPLNDKEWKYGANPMQVLNTVMKGSPDLASGMQAWEPVIGPTKVAEVVAYVMSYHEPPSN